MPKVEGMPDGKFIGSAKVGEKGQIVIPKQAREMFNIQPGETLLVMADINQGIALLRNDAFLAFAQQIMKAQMESTGEEEEE